MQAELCRSAACVGIASERCVAVLLRIVRIHTLITTPRQSGRTIRQGESDCAQRLERQDLPTRSIDYLEPAPAQVRAMPEPGTRAGEHILTPAGEQEHQHE